MGSWVSSLSDATSQDKAKIILPNGTLHKSFPSVTVQQVLEMNPGCFVCHSDSMCYDEPIPALAPDDELQVGQIYFVLPVAKLKQPLSAHDMAALAVKASVAISKERKRKKNRRHGGFVRVAPVGNQSIHVGTGGFKAGAEGGLKKMEGRRSAPLKRLRRGASLKARSVCRSFRLTLSTIYEELVLE